MYLNCRESDWDDQSQIISLCNFENLYYAVPVLKNNKKKIFNCALTNYSLLQCTYIQI